MTSDERGHQDPYCYPGSSVLINKYNIRSHEALAKVEFHTVRLAALTLPKTLPTEAGFKDTHLFLYGRLYSWAGHQRTTDLISSGIDHTRPAAIGGELARIFSSVKDQNNFHNLKPNEFAERSAPIIGGLAVTAPFRAGNDVTLKYFVTHLAEQAGHGFSTKALDQQAWVIAKQESAKGNHAPMADTIRSCIAAAPALGLRIDNAKEKPRPSNSRNDPPTR